MDRNTSEIRLQASEPRTSLRAELYCDDGTRGRGDASRAETSHGAQTDTRRHSSGEPYGYSTPNIFPMRRRRRSSRPLRVTGRHIASSRTTVGGPRTRAGEDPGTLAYVYIIQCEYNYCFAKIFKISRHIEFLVLCIEH